MNRSTYFLNRFYHNYFYAIVCLGAIASLILLKTLSPEVIEIDLSWETIATLVVGISAFYIGLIQLKSTNDEFRKNLFFEFNRRYDQLNDVLNEIHAMHKKELSEYRYEHGKVINDYLNLCSEQFYWYKKGRIDNSVWEYWFSGMKFHFQNPVVQKVLENEFNSKNNDSFYGFPSYLRQLRVIE